MKKTEPIFGKCSLCREEKELIDSHVIPRWFWKAIKKGHGHYKYIDIGQQKTVNAQEDQKSHLMCGACDRSFSNNERCIKHLCDRWFKYPKPNNLHIPIQRAVSVPYAQVKLFQLLTIWRMAISEKPLFQKVAPPEELIENIRQMLLKQEAGEPNFLPLVVIVDSSGGMKRSAMQPLWSEKGGFLWFAGGAWILSPLDASFAGGALSRKQGGTLPVGLKDFVKTPHFEELYNLRIKDKDISGA